MYVRTDGKSPHSTGLRPLSGPLPRYSPTSTQKLYKAGQGYRWPYDASWRLVYFFQSFFFFISFNLSFRLKPDVPNHPVWQYSALSVCSINKSKKKFRIGEKTPSTSLSDSIDLIQNFEIDIGGQEISNAIRFWHLDQSCISSKMIINQRLRKPTITSKINGVNL